MVMILDQRQSPPSSLVIVFSVVMMSEQVDAAAGRFSAGCLLFLLALSVGSGAAAEQVIRCWEGKSQTGNGLTLHGWLEKLTLWDFDDKISSCCAIGTWILYEDPTYNLYSDSDGVRLNG